MSGDEWHAGRDAWKRLTGWRPGRPYDGRSDGAPDGEGALAALDDIGLLRRLLDRAELVAVRSARRHGKSWAEIATRLGVSRQSAWERWRDVDEAVDEAHDEPAPSEPTETLAAAAAAASARRSRRQSTVAVPSVVGRTWDDARAVLLSAGLVGVGWDPDGLPLTSTGWPHAAVTDQSPESGAKVPPGTRIRLWLDFGGGSAGVREPRRPRPEPRSGRASRDEFSSEFSDEAVG